jgi:four helix bundle protein
MRNYKDLLVWEKAHKLTLAVYKITCLFPKEERYGLTSQVRRASASIAANLAEGCGRRSDGEMARYVQIAMGSGAELSYHFLLARDLGLLLARDLGLLQSAEYEVLNADVSEIMRMLSALSSKLRKAAA